MRARGSSRDPAAVDPRAEQAQGRGQDGDGAEDGAGDDGDRGSRDAAQGPDPDEVHAGHGDRDGRARDDHGSAGGSERRLECLADRYTSAALGARADDEEERVVDADRHPDQQHHGLGAVFDREQLAERSEQAEAGGDRAQREQDRDKRRGQRAEREQEHEQRERDREQLRAVQVAVDGAVPRLVGGDIAGLLDRQLRMHPRRAGHRCANALNRNLSSELCEHDRGASVSGELELRCEAERAEAPLDVTNRASRHGRALRVDVGELASRPPEPVLVHDRVAAGGFADGTVVECVRAADRAERDADDDERDPGCNCDPRVVDAPASDAHVRPPLDVLEARTRAPACPAGQPDTSGVGLAGTTSR